MTELRRWINIMTALTEAALPTLYHGSKKRFPDGFVLLPQSDGYLSLPEVQLHEQFIERYRPRGCLSRSRSVFMVADITMTERVGGYADYVYEVQPQGKVEKNDLAWYSELDLLDAYSVDDQNQIDLDDPEWIAAARNYWKGVPHHRAVWEYRSSAAIIVRRITQGLDASI